MDELTTTKTIKYVINGETEIKTVNVPMTDDDVIQSRINALKILVAKWEATQEEKEELQLLK